MRDLWKNRIVAFAYKYQREAKPYKQPIRDFASFLSFNGGETVLDNWLWKWKNNAVSFRRISR